MADRKVDTGIIQRGNTYRFTAYLGYDMNGKQIRKTSTFTPPEGLTQRKADALAKAKYIEFKNRCNGLSSFNENMRFAELAEEYFKVYAPNRLKPITSYNYEKIYNYHFKETLGNKKLRDINTASLSGFFNTHKAPDRSGNLSPLSSANAKKLYTVLQSIFTFAVHQNYIKESPAVNVILPTKSSTEEKRKSLTEEELPRFLSLFEGYSDFNTMIKVLLFTGMRSGEMLGLQWSDIDFEGRWINVNHTLSDVGGKHFLTSPKTKGSKRKIAMNSTVYELLKEHRIHQKELQMALPVFNHPEMVFTSLLGNYKDRNALNTSFRRFLKGTEFDFLTLHCLRHSNATLLLSLGVDLKQVSEHLGHSDVGTTGNIYADVLDSTRRRTADILQFKLAT